MADKEVPLILNRISEEDLRAADRLFPLVYQQLRQSAQKAMNAITPCK